MNTVVKAQMCDFVRKQSSSCWETQRRTMPRSPSGNSGARAMQRSGSRAQEAIFTIDKRRVRGLSSEKIFVAVCERSLSHATEARGLLHTLRRNGSRNLESLARTIF
jgi:hypothetical protein